MRPLPAFLGVFSLLAAPTALAGTEYPLTLDNCGVSLSLPAAPERVVAIRSTSTEMLLALGLGERIVGVAFQDGLAPEPWTAQSAALPVLAEKLPSPEVVLEAEPDLVYAGWMPDYNDPYTYLSYFVSSNSQNGGKFSNARYDELVNTANTFADTATRLEMYQEAETILMEEAGIVPLQVRQVPWAYDSHLKNLVRFYLGSEIDYTYAYFE